jgi:hypothetical protein
LPYLADDEAARTHSERLLHQTPEGNLAGSFEVRLSGLHGDDVGQPQLKFEDLFHGDHALAGWNGRT